MRLTCVIPRTCTNHVNNLPKSGMNRQTEVVFNGGRTKLAQKAGQNVLQKGFKKVLPFVAALSLIGATSCAEKTADMNREEYQSMLKHISYSPKYITEASIEEAMMPLHEQNFADFKVKTREIRDKVKEVQITGEQAEYDYKLNYTYADGDVYDAIISITDKKTNDTQTSDLKIGKSNKNARDLKFNLDGKGRTFVCKNEYDESRKEALNVYDETGKLVMTQDINKHVSPGEIAVLTASGIFGAVFGIPLFKICLGVLLFVIGDVRNSESLKNLGHRLT